MVVLHVPMPKVFGMHADFAVREGSVKEQLSMDWSIGQKHRGVPILEKTNNPGFDGA
jgi:hypothetical protein